MTTLLPALALKSSLLLLVGWALAALLARASAAARHHLWRLTLVCALALPVAMLALPPLSLPVLRAAVEAPATPIEAVSPLVNTDAPPLIAAAPEPIAPVAPHLTLGETLAAIWLLGALILALRLAADLMAMWRLARAAQTADEPALAELAARLALRRRVRLAISPQVSVPQAIGIWRAAILLPPASAAWARQRRRVVLLHELAHIQRWDCAWQVLARAAVALYWWNPLAWLAARQLRLASEQTADAVALVAAQADSVAPHDYAAHLVAIARALLPNAPPLPLAAAMARSVQLESRVGAILNPRRHTRWTAAAGVPALLLFAGAMAALAVARPTLRDQSRLRFDVATVREWKPGNRPNRVRNDVWRQDPGRVVGQYSPLSALLRYAFDLTGAESVEGLPDWAGSVHGTSFSADNFYVDGRMPASTTDAQARLMMQSLLADRFKLAWHWTTKSTKALELIVDSGRLKLKHPQPAENPKLPAGMIPTCPSDVSGCTFIGPMAMTMGELARALSGPPLELPVVDKTGLSGAFFVPEIILIGSDSTSATVPSAPTELQEVTGLKLRPATDPLPVLVIDHVEKPQSDAGAPEQAPLAAAHPAQQSTASAPPLPSFEAASVKPAPPMEPGEHSSEHSDPVHLVMLGTVHRLLIRGYGITDHQLSGEPDWFKSDLFTIDAVTAGPTTNEQKMLMLRRLLAERFQLQMREQDLSVPGYALEIARGGPKFRELKPGERPVYPSEPAGTFVHPFTSMTALVNSLNDAYGGRLHVDRPVVDRTGLTGRYWMVLQTEIDEQSGAAGGRGFTFPNLARDLRTELGLKLVSEKVPMSSYTVLHAARPTPN